MGDYSLEDKLRILSDAAKYDVACTSSGVDRKGMTGSLGNCSAAGICHTFASDGRCISLLKILFSNECVFDCKYCINRRSNDVERTSFTPDEVCTLTMEFYRRNYIEGLFLSSGVKGSPDRTMELMYEAIYKLRCVYNFRGYIHVKAIPGASEELIERMGFLADRMSVNLELPTADGLKMLAPHKNRRTITGPMRLIQSGISMNRLALNKKPTMDRAYGNDKFTNGIFKNNNERYIGSSKSVPSVRYERENFVPAGQSTQMIIGATGESDYQIMKVSQALYTGYDLKRVFYSAYVPINDDSALPVIGTPPPLLREHRLYQADWLLRFYGFTTDELLSEDRPNFNVLLDPKCDWALRHLECFPVEINKADYETLLKVPGIGVKSARRIIMARRSGMLNFDDIKHMGVVLKRAAYFITCLGRTLFPLRINEDYITRQLISSDRRTISQIENDTTYRQLSLFDDMKLDMEPMVDDSIKVISGQL